MSNAAGEIRPLAARDAYRLWAAGYHEETAVTELERHAVDRVTPPLAGRALLDAGCGTARRLNAVHGAQRSVGIDLVADMILAGLRTDSNPPQMNACAADLRALPLRDTVFDVVWCRLVLGHVPDPAPAYDELSRVAATTRSTLIVTDFHPVAAAAGHTRSFRDEAGSLHSIQHHIHPAQLHIEHAQHCGWRLREQTDLTVGPAIRTFYEDADAMDRYRDQLGMPLVLMLVFER
jgi:malonyl-CoA O-methyltransferase